MWGPQAPSERARSTNNLCLTVNTWARTKRAVDGHEVIPITKMMFQTDRPSTEARTMASGRKGMTRNHSVIRIRKASSLPPTNPETMPDHRADEHGEHRRRQPDEEADPRSPDELGPHRAPDVVGAQRRKLARRCPLRIPCGSGEHRAQLADIGQQGCGQCHQRRRPQEQRVRPSPVGTRGTGARPGPRSPGGAALRCWS